MSESNPAQLQRHKDTVRDTLQGLLDTVSQVPGLIHDSSSKEVCRWGGPLAQQLWSSWCHVHRAVLLLQLGAVISATAIREGAYTKTQEASWVVLPLLSRVCMPAAT